MAFSDLKFAKRLLYKDIADEIYNGMIQYRSNGDFMVDIADDITFSCYLANSFVDVTLFEYVDGSKLIFSYTLSKDDQDPATWTLTYKYRLENAQGQLINCPDWPNPTGTYTKFLPWSDTQPGYDVLPFSEMHFVTANCNYAGENDTVVNDPVQTVYVWGGVYAKKSRPPVGGYSAFVGVQPLGTLWGSYEPLAGQGGISNATDYNEYFGVADPTGKNHGEGEEPTPPDPSDTGGGDKPIDDDGDPIDFPDLPATGVINTGLITLFNPDDTKLRSLAGVLWSNGFESSIRKILNDPFDGIISLTMVPFTPTTSGSINCEIGNFDTEISMPLISAQYYSLSCGSLTIKENWKNALDYSATSAEIFVPFVGFRPLNIQDVMDKSLTLKYMVDILTGSGVAILKCGNKCMYTWPCNLGYTVPLTGSNRAALYTGLIQTALSGATGVLAGGAMGGVMGAATSAINVATHSQSDVQRSGGLVSNTGILGDLIPYVLIHRPNQSMAKNFKTYKGYQSNITASLVSCKGYTEVEYVHLTGISGATDTELNEIEALLKKGVII